MDLFESLTIAREFLGWDRPALPEAARRLATRYRNGKSLDLGSVIVVVPGNRAGRRLQELLAFLAEDDGLLLTPPEVVTEGLLPELLYPPKKPFASDLVQDLAWAKALRELPAPMRRNIIPQPPDGDARRWLELGQVFRRLHLELAADGLDFAAVLQSGPKLAHFNETQRWQALTELQRRYHLLLDARELWDKQTARLKAIEFHEIQTERDVILLGTVDLNASLRQMLDQVSDRVTAYVIAPENLADHFDALGCLVPERWRRAAMPLQDQQIEQVEGPAEQADAVACWLAEMALRFRCNETVIGVPDESLVPQLQRQLKQLDVTARWVEGARLGDTAPYRLLAAAVEFAGSGRYDDLATLVRHPDLEEWVQPRCVQQTFDAEAGKNRTDVPKAWSLPAQLDRFYSKRLPGRITARDTEDNADKWPDLAVALAQIEAWLAEASTDRPLRLWGDCFRRLLAPIYDHRILNLDDHGDDVLRRTIRMILAECDRLNSLPEALDSIPLSAADAFHIALGPVANETLPPPADPSAVEILGWLELPLDDGPALIVTTFNEGFVPKSAGADAFLPDRLRAELGLMHNERRYARDAYATSVLCHTRRELRVVFARRDTKKEPLHPSRLLFACDDETLVARAQRFFGKVAAPPVPPRLLLAAEAKPQAKSSFVPPAPAEPFGEVAQIPVTHFRSYLACPYRYYLRHVRKLEAIDDAARELGGDLFGSLLHHVLSRFGRNTDVRGSRRERDITEFLVEALRQEAKRLYGSDQRRAAVRLQLEQARLRLTAFAHHQAELASAGWRIIFAEDEDDSGDSSTSSAPKSDKRLAITFEALKDRQIQLVGRIDRIDFHEADNAIRILDYKTADKVQTPEQTHRRRDEWIDLQLPLYRHLWCKAVPKLHVDKIEKVELAYLNLPRDAADANAGFAPAPWTDEELRAADQVACAVIRGILARKFLPVTQPPPDFSEDFAAICLDNRYEQADADDDEENKEGEA
jgi:hypothetical protein